MGLGDYTPKGDKRARIRHIQDEAVCGYKLENGKVCLIRHEYPGQPCFLHTPVPRQALRPYRIYEGMASMQNGAIAGSKKTALHQLLAKTGTDEEQALFVALSAEADTLQDVDALLRVRLLALQKQLQNYEITQKQYDEAFFKLSEQIRKNTETRVKAKLAQAQLDKDNPDRFGQDAFNPTQIYSTSTEDQE